MIRVLDNHNVLEKCRATTPAAGGNMGEVRTTLKLTNALDEERLAEGALNQGEVRIFYGSDEALVLGDEILIGQTVLEKLHAAA